MYRHQHIHNSIKQASRPHKLHILESFLRYNIHEREIAQDIQTEQQKLPNERLIALCRDRRRHTSEDAPAFREFQVPLRLRVRRAREPREEEREPQELEERQLPVHRGLLLLGRQERVEPVGLLVLPAVLDDVPVPDGPGGAREPEDEEHAGHGPVGGVEEVVVLVAVDVAADEVGHEGEEGDMGGDDGVHVGHDEVEVEDHDEDVDAREVVDEEGHEKAGDEGEEMPREWRLEENVEG